MLIYKFEIEKKSAYKQRITKNYVLVTAAKSPNLRFVIFYGKEIEENGYPGQTAEVSAILTMLNNSEQRERDYALRLLKLFLAYQK